MPGDVTHRTEGRTLGIVAGGGPLPLKLADAAVAEGRKVYIVGVLGAAETDIEKYPHDWVRLGALGRLRRLLQGAGCQDVMLIGSATRPRLLDLMPDFEGALALPGFIRRLRTGDDALLRGVVEFLESHKLNVIGAQTILTDLLAPHGLLTQKEPGEVHRWDIALGMEAARELGRQDIGQGVVMGGGLVLEREDIKGTDAMLMRVAELRKNIPGQGGVLVKLPKPTQDRRVDLPTIGVRTVERAAAAGLDGIAVEAGGTLINERDETVRRADELGLFIFCFEPDTGEST